jgi:hypothetical protein
MLNYHFDLKLNLKELIVTFFSEIDSDDKISMLLTFSCLVKTDFILMDEEFKNFGKLFLSLIKNSNLVYMNFICDSFSELMLKNMDFSQSELFPDKDIRMIKSKLQVKLVLEGKNFILLPNVLEKCSDIQFQFK